MYTVFGILIVIAIIGIIKLFITGHPGLGILMILCLVVDFFSFLFLSEVFSMILLIVGVIVAFV